MRKSLISLCLLAGGLAVSGCGRSDGQATGPAAPAATAPSSTPARPVALGEVKPMSAIALAVTSGAIDATHRIAARYTAYDQGLSPPLAWGSVAGVQSWVLIVEDPDAGTAQPFLHWLAWNIPASTANLPAGASPSSPLSGMVSGLNSGGMHGWIAPHPPPGTGDHHYHFQVFALDTKLDLPATASRDEVVAAMTGHVLAAGETVGLAAAP